MKTVKVLRPFHSTPQGGLVGVGDVIEVDETRAAELARNGLVETVRASEKAAPAADNKMAPAPENKARRSAKAK